MQQHYLASACVASLFNHLASACMSGRTFALKPAKSDFEKGMVKACAAFVWS